MQPVEHRFVLTTGELCWLEWGKPGNQPTLLLLHATGFHARCWDATVAALPEGWHVTALDLPGHGRSYRPASLSDWLAITDDVSAFVRETFVAPVLAVGHSMGGVVAARLAAQAPDKVARLLMIDPVIMAPNHHRSEPDHMDSDSNAHPVARRRNMWESAEQMIDHFSAREPYVHWRPDVLADYCRYGLVPAKTGAGLELACPPVLEASAYMGSSRSNPHDWVGQIACPTTILRARNSDRKGPMDFSVSPTDPDLALAIPGACDLHWPEISHFIPMEAPDRLARLIEEVSQSG